MGLSDLNWFDIGVAISTGLIGAGTAVVAIWRKACKKCKPVAPTIDHSFSVVDGEIHERLTELRLASAADRAIVSQFHNGGYFASGHSMRKFSYTHESTAIGVSPTIHNPGEKLVTQYIDLMKLLSSNSPAICSFDKLDPTSLLAKTLASEGIKWFACLPLFSADNMIMIGFVILEWEEIEQPVGEAWRLAFEKAFLTNRDHISVLLLNEGGSGKRHT